MSLDIGPACQDPHPRPYTDLSRLSVHVHMDLATKVQDPKYLRRLHSWRGAVDRCGIEVSRWGMVTWVTYVGMYDLHERA